ncbi:hypothetical protein PAEPH01_1065 [Pancytospora epiphaga]|nr:hypothetical protein PAEPH01_1065 [Pancytospora epiphaga]
MLFKEQLLTEYKNKQDKIMKRFVSEHSILSIHDSLPVLDPSTSIESCSITSTPSNSKDNTDTKEKIEVTPGRVDDSAGVALCKSTTIALRRSIGRKPQPNTAKSPARRMKRSTSGNRAPSIDVQTSGNSNTQDCVAKDTWTVSNNEEQQRVCLDQFSKLNIPISCVTQINETIIPDESRIQDYSYFVGDQTQTIDTLNGCRRRRATRRTGKRVQKRQNSPCLEFPDVVKRLKTEKVESYLIEYYQKLRSLQTRNSAGEVEEEKKKWVKKVRKVRKEALNLKVEMEKELEAVRKMKDELKDISEKKKGEEAALEAKLALEVEQNRRLREEIEEDRKRLEEYQKLIESEMTRKSENELRNAKKSMMARTILLEGENALESKIFVERQMNSNPSDISVFFAAARKEHIEKVNQTMVSRTILNDTNDTSKQKATFNSTPHVPQQPVFKMSEIRPQELYKRTIDAQNADTSPRDYVPKTVIPMYESEDEFLAKEKMFEPGLFTKDPSLWAVVRNQNHGEIRRFFGSQTDINVAEIFSHVKNVTNFSPNKLVRRGKKS